MPNIIDYGLINQIIDRNPVDDPLSDDILDQKLESFSYRLRMFWQHRSDKLSSSDVRVCVQLTNAFFNTQLPNDYKVPFGIPVMFADKNHHELAREAMAEVRHVYRLRHPFKPKKVPWYCKFLRCCSAESA